MVEGPIRKFLKDREEGQEPVKWDRPYHEVEVLRTYAQLKQDISEMLDDPMGLPKQAIRTKIDRLNDINFKLSDKDVIGKKVFRGLESHINAMRNVSKRRKSTGIYDWQRMQEVAKDTSTYVQEKVEPEIARWFLSRGALTTKTDASTDRYEQLRREQWGD